MRPSGVRAFAGLRRASVQKQIIAGMVVLVVLAIAAASLPAYALIHAELEQQAWTRVEEGGRKSRGVLEGELVRLADLATLAAQRPTLLALTTDRKTTELEAYLETFRAGAAIDSIVVRSGAGDVIAGASLSGFALAAVEMTGARIVAVPGSGAGATLAASAAVGGAGSPTVSVYRLLDERFLSDLGQITGLHYSLLLDGKRIATTLPGYPPVATTGAVTSDSAEVQREILAAAAPFFAITTDLGPSAAGLELESALSVAEMQQEERRALLLLVAATLVAAAVVFGLGFALSRRLARPPGRVTRSAQRIRQGDLDTTVPIPDGPAEIAALASMLEAGRVHTRATVETLLREKAWSESLIRSVVEGIVTVDRAGRIATFSPGAERLTGWRAAEATGQPAANVFRTPDGSAFLEKLPPPGGRRAVQVVDRSGRTLTLSITDARFPLPSNRRAPPAPA